MGYLRVTYADGRVEQHNWIVCLNVEGKTIFAKYVTGNTVLLTGVIRADITADIPRIS